MFFPFTSNLHKISTMLTCSALLSILYTERFSFSNLLYKIPVSTTKPSLSIYRLLQFLPALLFCDNTLPAPSSSFHTSGPQLCHPVLSALNASLFFSFSIVQSPSISARALLAAFCASAAVVQNHSSPNLLPVLHHIHLFHSLTLSFTILFIFCNQNSARPAFISYTPSPAALSVPPPPPLPPPSLFPQPPFTLYSPTLHSPKIGSVFLSAQSLLFTFPPPSLSPPSVLPFIYISFREL